MAWVVSIRAHVPAISREYGVGGRDLGLRDRGYHLEDRAPSFGH
jgi:hypothetical protein